MYVYVNMHENALARVGGGVLALPPVNMPVFC